MKVCLFFLMVPLSLSCVVSLVSAETIPWDVVGSGGAKATSADFQLLHTVGQQVVNLVGNSDYVNEQGFWYLCRFALTGVAETQPVQKVYRLDQNYPNPFNPATTIAFALAKPSHVRLQIYDVTGRLVMTLIDRHMDAGEHKVQFAAGDLASGVYLYRLSADRFMETEKFVVVK